MRRRPACSPHTNKHKHTYVRVHFHQIISFFSRFSHQMQIPAPTLRVNCCSSKKDVNDNFFFFLFMLGISFQYGNRILLMFANDLM